MKRYLVKIPHLYVDDKSVWVEGEVRAKSWQAAEEMAEHLGYELIGPLLSDSDVEVVEAMIDATNSTVN